MEKLIKYILKKSLSGYSGVDHIADLNDFIKAFYDGVPALLIEVAFDSDMELSELLKIANEVIEENEAA